MGRWWTDAGALVASSPSSISFLPQIVSGFISGSETHTGIMSPRPRSLYEHKGRGIGQTEVKMDGVGPVASNNPRDIPSDCFDVRLSRPSPHSKQGGPAKGIDFSYMTSITKVPSYHDNSPKFTTLWTDSILHGSYLSGVRGGER